MKLKLISIFILINSISFGQSKFVNFYSYILWEYQGHVPLNDGSWTINYKNQGESYSRGTIELNDNGSHNKFMIRWENGVVWKAINIVKKKSEKSNDFMIGDVTKTTYSGKWENEVEFEFIIFQNVNLVCAFELHEEKVIEEQYKIDGWARMYRFGNEGRCLM